MSSTEQRAGFRLTWDESPSAPVDDEPSSTVVAPHADEAPPTPDEPVTAPSVPAAQAEPAGTARPSRLMADLVRAMRTAANESRSATLESLRVESRTFVEGVRTRSTDEAAGLRREADDDLAAIREWSKAEIARIRSATDRRLAERKKVLETALADHAALVELEIEGIGEAVMAFEAEMAQFFDRLATIEEPSAFAATAATIPDPPSLDEVGVAARERARTALAVPATAPQPGDPEAADVEAESAIDESATYENASAENASDASATDESSTDQPAPNDNEDLAADDPRLAALALAVAESEAAVDAASEDFAGEPLDEVDEERLSGRLAGLVPADGSPNGSSPVTDETTEATATTHVVVVGLVNVASIASFKRHVARVHGVASVGVSSGPDGEFVFTAAHVPNVSLRDIIPTLPGFGARVTGSSEGVLTVSARDPEQDS